MRRQIPAQPRPLKCVGGDPSLDLINTADWTERGIENERLRDYADLLRWAVAAGVITEARARRLRSLAAGRPTDARAALRKARRTRAALLRLFRDVTRGAVEAKAWGPFERLVAAALRRLRLAPGPRGGVAARWEWREDDRLESVLWPVVRSAATLLTSEEAGQIRICAGDSCGWVFVDRSRNGLRRWCEMRICGTTAKSDRRRDRTGRRPGRTGRRRAGAHARGRL